MFKSSINADAIFLSLIRFPNLYTLAQLASNVYHEEDHLILSQEKYFFLFICMIIEMNDLIPFFFF